MYLLLSFVMIGISIMSAFLMEKAYKQNNPPLVVACLVLLILTGISAGLMLAKFTHGV